MNLKNLFSKAFEEYGITEEQIKSKKRDASIITVKNILICYLVKIRGFHLEKVAKEFNLHRTSVIHILKQNDLYKDQFKLFKNIKITTDQDIINKALEQDPSKELKEYLLNFNK